MMSYFIRQPKEFSAIKPNLISCFEFGKELNSMFSNKDYDLTFTNMEVFKNDILTLKDYYMHFILLQLEKTYENAEEPSLEKN